MGMMGNTEVFDTYLLIIASLIVALLSIFVFR
jgi:hypothetical protein